MSEQTYSDAMDNSMRFDDARPVAASPVVPLGNPNVVQHTIMEIEGGSIPVTLAGGKLPGEVAWVVYSVAMKQLKPASTGVLRSDYDPAKDTTLVELANSIKEHGGLMQPLLGRLTGQTVEVNGEERVEIEVWAGIRRYHALKHNHAPRAEVRLLKGINDESQMLLFALAEQEVRKSLSLLDMCDTAARLHRVYKYNQRDIGLYLGYGENNAQTRATDMIRAAEQSDPIRRLMAAETLTLTHVTTLIERIPDTEANAAQLRDRAARFAAQEKLSTRDLQALLSAMKPLPKSGIRALDLIESVDGKRIIKQNVPTLSLPTEKFASVPAATVTPVGNNKAATLAHDPTTFSAGPVSPTSAAAARPVPYWQRNSTMFAQPTEIEQLARTRHIVLGGTPEEPLIDAQSLGTRAWLELLGKRRQRMVTMEQLEAEYQADLEAVRAILEGDANEEPGPNIVPMVAPQRDSNAEKLTG